MYRFIMFGVLIGALSAVCGCGETSKPKKQMVDAEGLPLDPAARKLAEEERDRQANEAAEQAERDKKEFEKATSTSFDLGKATLKTQVDEVKAAQAEMERIATEAQAKILAAEKAAAEAARKKEAEDKALLEKQSAEEAKAEEARIAAEAKALKEQENKDKEKDGKSPTTPEKKP